MLRLLHSRHGKIDDLYGLFVTAVSVTAIGGDRIIRINQIGFKIAMIVPSSLVDFPEVLTDIPLLWHSERSLTPTS